MATDEPLLVPDATVQQDSVSRIVTFRKVHRPAQKSGDAARKGAPQPTAEEREQKSRAERRSFNCDIKCGAPGVSVQVPRGYHIFDVAIIGTRWRYILDIVARTKDEAQLEAIRLFDSTWPHIRARRIPIRVCFESIDGKEASSLLSKKVSWKWAFPLVDEGSLWKVTCAHPKLGKISTFRVRADNSKRAASKARQMFARELQCVATECPKHPEK